MSKTRVLIPCLAALLMLPFGCTKQSAVPGPDEDVRVSLALSVGGSRQPGTKMSESVTQHVLDPDSFRGIERVFILPFRTVGAPVTGGDELWDYRLSLPQLGLAGKFMHQATSNAGLIYNNYAHLYDIVYLRPETDAVLVYGKATDASAGTAASGSVAFRQHNGVLVTPDLDEVRSTDEILFSLDPISDDVPGKNGSITWRVNLMNFLNSILAVKVNAKGGNPKYYFNDPASYNNHPKMTAALEDFTNKGIYLPLSSEVWNERLTKLYQAIYPLSTDANQSADYYYVPKNGVAFPYVHELAKAIVKAIYDATLTNDENPYTYRIYDGKYHIYLKDEGPEIYGLPSGTIPIQLQEGNKTFKIVENIDHFSGLRYLPDDGICYPPSLWYYGNSPLVTTDQGDIQQKYTSTYSWDDICSNYADAGISAHSSAAAVRDPVQYGVALLELKCNQAGASQLKDYNNTNIAVNNTSFPLTGIILADQYQQVFDFTPLPSTDDRAEMRYLYDADVNDTDGNARAWLSSTQESATLSTLVLPTRPGADVRFALEFLNNTTKTIIGANGCKIFPKCHFYLAGILEYSHRNYTPGNDCSSIFVRDHATEVLANFSSLKAAYDVIPDLTEPQLQLGVQAKFGWNLTTPVNVPVVIQ